MSDLLKVVVDIGEAMAKLDAADRLLGGTVDLHRDIAGMLESTTRTNFEAQGRPAWVPLASSTVRARAPKGKARKETRADFVGPQRQESILKILQRSGTLAASISTEFGADYALIGAATPYAGVHQFGGTITHPAHSVKVRLRTTAKGDLARQADHKNLAVFARDSHKRVRESWHEVGEYTIKIPARPYLPFSGPPNAPVLQPEAERGIQDIVDKLLRRAFE